MVVLWCPFEQGVYEDERCAFVHGSRLRDWLESHPDKLGQTQADAINEAIATLSSVNGPGS